MQIEMNNKRISRIQEFIQMALKIKQICTELTLRQAYYSSAPSKFHWDGQNDEADSTELTLEVRVELCKSESAICTGLRVRPFRELTGPTVWRISNTKSEPFYKKGKKVKDQPMFARYKTHKVQTWIPALHVQTWSPAFM